MTFVGGSGDVWHPLKWSYSEYGHLATDATWFQNLWHLGDTFKVDISLCQEDQISGAREEDRSLMLKFHQLGFQGKELKVLNIVR